MAQARRVALAAQGFGGRRPLDRVDVRHVRRFFADVGVLQIDSVNVAVRAHYMPMFSRFGPYGHPLIDEGAYGRRELFEYWGHEASFLPSVHYPLLRHRMEAIRPWHRVRALKEEHPEYLDQVYQEVLEYGPITVSDLEDPGKRTGPWWGYGKGKIALEFLFATGKLAIAERRNFTRYYDLPERVLPAEILALESPGTEEAQRQLLLMAAASTGIATAADLADYYRIRMPAARPRIAELAESGALEEVTVEGWDKPAYKVPGTPVPRAIDAAALISPFDSLIWFRERTERLFGFHYRIEIYVPEPQRIFGYYVYPFLLGDELVGRVDLKADRTAGKLLVRGSFAEDGRDHDRIASALAEELHLMAGWLDLDDVVVERRGDLATELVKRV
ncbi:MAG: crosslink repair DNA glycosylase YcaQ family protein [Acidimicrobiia bacterium]|nr:crosslink repair DNA glycosylase YcaQ family protein [Acidimicrobiia bacterium]